MHSTEARYTTQTFANDLAFAGTYANIQMCKLMRANPQQHCVSESARLSQLQVIHKPCALSQRGTGASSASSACQIAVLGAVENLPDIALFSITDFHSTVTHTHTLSSSMDQIRSTSKPEG